MGRYIDGDIQHKLFFALQSSDSAKRFGGRMSMPGQEEMMCGELPEIIEFSFGHDDLSSVEAEIAKIEDSESFDSANRFIEESGNYLNPEVLRSAGLSEANIRDAADRLLGLKIRDQIKEAGACYFVADL